MIIICIFAVIYLGIGVQSLPMTGENYMAEGEPDFEKPLYKDNRFGNPLSFTGWTGLPGFRDVFKWKFVEENNSSIPDNKILEETLPVHKPDLDQDSRLSLTWLGHATCLVKVDNITLITDPVWSNRASPFSYLFGPRRYRPPPIPLEELPKLDLAVISHNHYDHLDAYAVQTLASRFSEMLWFVPSGLKSWMVDNGVQQSNVHEMNWGEQKTFELNGSKCSVWCIPAQHWSQRALTDRFKSLWSGWAVVGESRRFYYSGDTGFCEREFEVLGRKLGPFDLAAIPIGCYAPRWFMKPQHIDPAEAVKIHQRIGSKKTIAIHWGTYEMGSNEGYLDPPRLLEEEVIKAGIKAEDFTALGHGETWYEEDSTSSKTDQSSCPNQ